jgi:hypothetical protein
MTRQLANVDLTDCNIATMAPLTGFTRAVRLFSTVSAFYRKNNAFFIEDGRKSWNPMTPTHFPKLLFATCILSGFSGFFLMDSIRTVTNLPSRYVKDS